MSFWESNATWLTPGAWFLSRKWVKSVRQVALEGSDVVLEVQHDVTAGTRPICDAKR